MGTVKTYVRDRYMKIFNKKLVYDYDNILAMNILESMRAVNVSKITNDIATFTWNNIPICSQVGLFWISRKGHPLNAKDNVKDAKLEIISKFEIVVNLKSKRALHSCKGLVWNQWILSLNHKIFEHMKDGVEINSQEALSIVTFQTYTTEVKILETT